MPGFEANILVENLGQLGRDLDSYVATLGELDERAVDLEGTYRFLDEEYNDRFAEEFLNLQGSVEQRKMQARLKAKPARLIAGDAWLEWNKARAKLRTHQASISALHRRIEIGRSMLSREKTLMELDKTL